VDTKSNYFDYFKFEHNALPELNFGTIDTSTKFLGKQVAAPILISSMTGGASNARKINLNLARAAEAKNIPMGLGSCRVLIEKPKTLSTFNLKKKFPGLILLANLGAVQLNYGFEVMECKKIVDLTQANALILHLNPLQEVIQSEGDRNFSGLLKKIEKVVKGLKVPVIIKEVGAGISKDTAARLKNIGVKIIDISGQGGTSWSYIESKRKFKKKNNAFPETHPGSYSNSSTFADWGIPTPLAIKECSKVKGINLIASGGVRSGLDIAKSLSLGAEMAGLALPFLQAANKSSQKVEELIDELINDLKISMFCTGSKTISELKKQNLINYAEELEDI